MKSIIIYATKYGCSEKAAKMLKERLKGETHMVNIANEKVPSLKEYDNVILGGSIYVGKIQKELTSYISNNLTELMSKKIGLFICGALKETDKIAKEFKDAFPETLSNRAVTKEMFGYEFSFDKMSFFDKIATKTIVGIKSSISELNEDAIENFAKVINSEI